MSSVSSGVEWDREERDSLKTQRRATEQWWRDYVMDDDLPSDLYSNVQSAKRRNHPVIYTHHSVKTFRPVSIMYNVERDENHLLIRRVR
jgi:hypothetical protein